MDTDTPLHLAWITSKDPVQSPGSSAQSYLSAWMGGGLGQDGYRSIYGRVALLTT